MRTSHETPKGTMTTSEKGSTGPVELQGPQQELHEPQGEPSQMIIDLEDQPAGAAAPQHPPSIQSQKPPGYLPRNSVAEEKTVGATNAGPVEYHRVTKHADQSEPNEEYYDDDSSSEVDLQHTDMAAWADSPGNASDVVAHSSDEYGDDMDDIQDDGEDEGDGDDDDDDEEDDDLEDDEENFSDDTPDTDELQEVRGKTDYQYNRPLHHGPYLKSRRQAEQLRKSQGRPAAPRKRPLKLRTISGPGPHSDSATTAGAAHIPVQEDDSSEADSSQQDLTQSFEEVTVLLHQGPIQQGVGFAKRLIEQAITWRTTGDKPTECPYTAEHLSILEHGYFATWAKLLLDRRPGPNNAAIVSYLNDFVQLGCLIVQRDNIVPELYAQVMHAMFEQGDLEIYKRNPKRPSRLAHVERMARFDEYASEYGPEDEEVPQLQQEFQRRFFDLGGLDICLRTIEVQMESTDYPDTKLRRLLLLLSLISRILVLGDSEHSQFSRLSDYSRRLIAAILGYFPDNVDSFRSVAKAVVQEIISLVGHFLLENYESQPLHLQATEDLDVDYEEFDLQDPISRFNLGEVKFADFRLEMAVRLMKTSRLDLRLAGLVELKDVLIRIQRPQSGRPRLRRRSETDMDVQMDLDRKPIEHLCSKLQSMQIVGCIFGPNIHLEIVQRSADVLVFLMHAHVLTIDDIELIWAAVGGNQHRSIVYGVYNVLCELSNKLPHDYLRVLFNKLQAVPLGVWDQQLLDLSRSLFTSMVQRSKHIPEEGPVSLIPYETLLNVLRNSTPPLNSRDDATFGTPPSNRDVISGIAQLLKDGLQVGPMNPDREKLVEYCIQDLKANHPGAIWSLQVLQHILESHFAVNESLRLQFYRNNCSSLSELYISNLKAFTSAVKALPPTPSPTVSAFAPLSMHHLTHEYWRALQLKMRLDFLGTMARTFPVYWNSPELAETLWSSLIVDPIGAQEQDETFLCLEVMKEPHFIEFVYEKLLPGLTTATITQRAWQCVRRYFVLLNLHKRNLAESNDGSQGVIVLAPLHGMDLIWDIALHARLPIVGAIATDLLSSLIKAHHVLPEGEIADAVYGFREGLVETCVGHLVASSDHLSSKDTMDVPDVSLVFERCIGILKSFLVVCGAERSDGVARLEMHGTLDEDAMLTVKVSSNVTPMFQVSVHPSATLATLRKEIAARLNCMSPEEVRLFSLGKDLLPGWDNRTLEELQIENGQSFLANKRPQTAILNRPIGAEKRLPTDLLLKPGFFERVRQIFLLDERFASQAWEIVTRLPTSPVLLHSLQELQEGVDWAILLDARSPFLLLYSLQIVNSLIKRDQISEGSSRHLWIKRFLELGGQEYLTTLLMSDSGLGATNSSATARKALALMLKALVRLTSSSGIESSLTTGPSGVTIPAFLDKLVLEILTSASREGGNSPNDQSIVLNATNLISHLCSGPLGWRYFRVGPNVRSLIFVSMVQSDSTQIRQTVLAMGRDFCLRVMDTESSDVSPVMFFLNILRSFLPIAPEYQSNCTELFEFFEIVSREATHYCTEDFYKDLYTTLMETIMNHPSCEDMSLLKEDTVLVGMLKVATAVIKAEPRLRQLDSEFGIIDFIFDKCLFPQSPEVQMLGETATPTQAKCQSEGSRAAAFGYLEEAAKGEAATLRHIITKTRKHFERDSELEDQWGYDPQTTKKASCGLVGLQNLGATCYVNSLMQQFFMNKSFRHGILDAPVSEDDPAKHDTLLYQLQALFGNLQESIKRSYNAHAFCYAYKDWDGNPMNVAVQMDVDEFFSILFDRLENSVKSTPQEELFKRQYGGKLVQQIKSKDCEHISEREDSFFSIQCEVKNKKTLEESLQLYVQGEILDGDNKYKCSSCDKHVDAIKRACIKELPQNLILHLKRFDYDMDTMRRIKINDRFEFPTRLDMEPYTLDYLTRKEQAQEGAAASPSTHLIGGQDSTGAFQYNLVGVLVHTGTADSGHYYSYIKERDAYVPSDSPAHTQGSVSSRRWYFFNDSKVEEFDASEIPAKAFGGAEFFPLDSSPYMRSPPRSTTKPYSAYMLFYERAEHKTPEPDLTTTGLVPADIKDTVLKENITLLRDLAVFDRLHYRFVWDLFNLFRTFPEPAENGDDGEPQMDGLDVLSMQYGLDFFFYVLIHARDVDQELQQWTRFLSSLLKRYPKGCANFLRSLTTNQTLLTNVLLLCPITQVREAVIDLIYEALHGLREQDKTVYGLVASMECESFAPTPEPSENDDIWACAHGSPIHGLIRALLRLLPEARANWRNFDEYFKLVYNITQLGRAERVLMIREGYLSDLVEFYISDEKGDTKRKKMGDKFTKPSFRYLLLSVQEIVTTCDVPLSVEAFQRRGQVQSMAHGPASGHVYRKSSGSSSSSSSAGSSSHSDELVLENDTHIPSASPELDQAVLMSDADLETLLASHGGPGGSGAGEKSMILITKMLQDRIDSMIIAKLTIHLSSHPDMERRLLSSLSLHMHYANEDQITIVIHVFKELVQCNDERLETRVQMILEQLVKLLEHSPQPSIAYDCIDFFRAITDYGQCSRFAQAWLLQNNHVWLQELLMVQGDADTRRGARELYMELLSSERAFNGWTDEQAAIASAEHFTNLVEMMKSIPDMITYSSGHLRRDDDEAGWKFVEYFRLLSELVKGENERQRFDLWAVLIDVLIKLDSQQLNMDYDKKEAMVFWSKVMPPEGHDMNKQLALYKQTGLLLRKFYVCLQNNPPNLQFHREILPIYFGLVLRFCRLLPAFHMEWVNCHNYSWALGAMKWGTFMQHCPEELNQLLELTLSEMPQFRQDCWRMLPTHEAPRFHVIFLQLARAMFDPENEKAGALFYQHRGLIHLTEIINFSNRTGVAITSEDEFFAVDALTLLHGYLCQMTVCRNTPAFAEALDHWVNIHSAIELLAGNLMWTAPPRVFFSSVKILDLIAKEALAAQAAPLLHLLDKAHCELRNSLDSTEITQARVQSVFGGENSPFCQHGILEAPDALSVASSPRMRIGPSIFLQPELFKSLDEVAAQQVMESWFVPYWELTRSACRIDGGSEIHRKSVELSAMIATEQIPAGSLIHLDLLCEFATAASNNEEIMMSLQNPYVTLFMERLLRRESYIGALAEYSRLKACALLLKSVNLDDSLIAAVVEESLVCAEQVVDRTSAAPEEPLAMTEKETQDLITALQNVTILGVEFRDEDESGGSSARLRALLERLPSLLLQISEEKYKLALSSFILLTPAPISAPRAAPSAPSAPSLTICEEDDTMVVAEPIDGTSTLATTAATASLTGTGADSEHVADVTLSVTGTSHAEAQGGDVEDEEATMMTGIIQQQQDSDAEDTEQGNGKGAETVEGEVKTN